MEKWANGDGGAGKWGKLLSLSVSNIYVVIITERLNTKLTKNSYVSVLEKLEEGEEAEEHLVYQKEQISIT